METEDEKLEKLFRETEWIADREAGQVALGLRARVMSRIHESRATDREWAIWAWGFWRGAMVSAILVVMLGVWFWRTDYYASVSEELALSALSDERPAARVFPGNW